MSKNIIIQIDGTPEVLTGVEEIETSTGGGTQQWVPEDEQTQEDVVITKNGIYDASGERGISKATVEVQPDYVIGTGPDGKTHKYSVDDDGILYDEIIE